MAIVNDEDDVPKKEGGTGMQFLLPFLVVITNYDATHFSDNDDDIHCHPQHPSDNGVHQPLVKCISSVCKISMTQPRSMVSCCTFVGEIYQAGW